MRVKRLLGLSLILLFAGSAQAADLARTLERGVRVAGRNKGVKRINVAASDKTFITLRGDGGNNGHGVVVVTRPALLGLSATHEGYSLDAHDKLSDDDAKALNRSLARDPAATRANVVPTLRASMLARRADEERLASVEPKIDSLLAQAKQTPTQSRVLYVAGDRSIRYLMTGAGKGMIVVARGGDEHGITVDGDQRDVWISPADREDIGRLLLGQ